MSRIKVYFLAMRPQFFLATILPVVLGTSLAVSDGYRLNITTLILTLIAIVLYHGGINALNDYFDHLNGADAANKAHITPFTGGSRFIQDGLVTPQSMLALAVLLLTIGTLVGLYLAYTAGPILLIIGAFGLLTGIFYSAPPIFLVGRGLGELTVGVNLGLLTVAGSYLLQANSITTPVILISIPVAILIALVLYINEFPDADSDEKVGKDTLVVRLGVKKARWGFVALMATAYICLILSVASGHLRPLSLIVLLSSYFAIKASFELMKNYDSPSKLKPSIKATIAAHTTFTLLLIASNFIQYT